MIENLLSAALFILAGIVVYRFHPQILRAFRQFDANSRARIEGEIRDRADSLAHFRHTLKRAEEQVEEVQAVTVSDERTGTPVTRFLFEGETFASERDAVRAREEKVRVIARGFYMDLPAALRARKEDDRLGRE